MKNFKFKINGKEFETTVQEGQNGLSVIVNGKEYAVEVEQAAAAAKPVIKKIAAAAPAAAPVAAAPKKAASAGAVTAPLPGSITKIVVSVGQAVKSGDLLLTMEAMKMENNIVADRDGSITSILVQPGTTVQTGDALVEIA
ncbi:MAG: biotin/lipoyl-binding protein [Bacteroidaceae bacterium]|nr:biotin/lipoyl-binding protein [Bacteroidaceae bacterium]